MKKFMGDVKMRETQKVKTHATHGITQFELCKKVLNNLSQYKLTPCAKLVLLYLCDCYNPKKAEVFPKQKTIAQKLGVSEASVIRAICELHKEALIISERKSSNMYRLTSKIVAEASQNEKIFTPDKLQVENCQIEKQNCNLQVTHVHEQTKEQKTNKSSQKNKEFEKFSPKERVWLENYAKEHNATDVNKYINFLIRNNLTGGILAKKREAEQSQRYWQRVQKETKEIASQPRGQGIKPTECTAILEFKKKCGLM